MSIQPRFISDQILSGNAALSAEHYDLENRDRLYQQAIDLLSKQRRVICHQVHGYLSSLFNESPDEVSWCDISVKTMAELQRDELRTLWMKGISAQKNSPFLMIDCATIHAFSVLFLGGTVKESDDAIDLNTITDTEIRLGQQFFTHQINTLQPYTASTPEDMQIETVSADSLPKVGKWIDITFQVTLSQKLFTWHLLWPVNEQNIEQHHSEATTALVANLLTQIPVQLRLVLAEQSFPLNKLSNLKVGDVLPIELTDPTVAFLGNKPLFDGRVAEQRTHLVFQVLSIKNN